MVPIPHEADPNIAQTTDIAAEIKQMLALHPGRRLPSERDLAVRLAVSRVKLRSVLQALSAAGLIESRRGSGTYGIDPNARLRLVTLLVDRQLKIGDDPFFSHLVDLLQAALQRQSIRCAIERIGEPPRFSRLEPSSGAITLGQLAASVFDILPASPIVAMMPGDSARPKPHLSVFTLQDREAGRDAARLLIAQGCREIFFAGRRGVDASEIRYAGALEAAADAGVSVTLSETPLNYLGGLHLAETLRAFPTANAGVIAMNDWLAVGLRAGLGVSVRPLPVVSFDGLPIAAEPSLGIQSLAVPLEEIACDAVAELQRLSQPHAPSGRILSYRLQMRGSVRSDQAL